MSNPMWFNCKRTLGIACLSLLLLLYACGNRKMPVEPWIRGDAYIGYVSLPTSAVNTVKGYTNFVHVEPALLTGSSPGIYHQAGLQIGLNAHGTLFFEDEPNGRWHLRPDAEAALTAVKADLKDFAHDILYVYLIDEPTLNNASSGDLERASDIAKRVFPGVPTAFVEGFPTIERLVIPNNVDWIGFNYYGVNPMLDSVWQGYYADLKSRLVNNQQKIILVLDGWWAPFLHEVNGLTQADMAEVACGYLEWGRMHEEEIAAIGIFLWDAVNIGGGAVGSKDLPQAVRDAHAGVCP